MLADSPFLEVVARLDALRRTSNGTTGSSTEVALGSRPPQTAGTFGLHRRIERPELHGEGFGEGLAGEARPPHTVLEARGDVLNDPRVLSAGADHRSDEASADQFPSLIAAAYRDCGVNGPGMRHRARSSSPVW